MPRRPVRTASLPNEGVEFRFRQCRTLKGLVGLRFKKGQPPLLKKDPVCFTSRSARRDLNFGSEIEERSRNQFWIIDLIKSNLWNSSENTLKSTRVHLCQDDTRVNSPRVHCHQLHFLPWQAPFPTRTSGNALHPPFSKPTVQSSWQQTVPSVSQQEQPACGLNLLVVSVVSGTFRIRCVLRSFTNQNV